MALIDAVLIRMVRSWRGYKAGQVVSVTGGLARTLELDRYAVREPQPQFEFGTAPEPPAVERADAPHGKAKRRRRDA
jgi:hypothetical protein